MPFIFGTTSACAENTGTLLLAARSHRNYLRVRGEYFPPCQSLAAPLELPPRARRIHAMLRENFMSVGTTSACAENTFAQRQAFAAVRNYLRVRGEYKSPHHQGGGFLELPPRARRIHRASSQRRNSGGTTSACAENTRSATCPHSRQRNYLRVRGEYVH